MRSIVITAILLLIACTAVSATQNAGQAWNTYCGMYSFDSYPAPSNSLTFADCYHGNNLPADFAAIKSLVSQVMKASSGTVYDDFLNASLENWGSSGGGM